MQGFPPRREPPRRSAGLAYHPADPPFTRETDVEASNTDNDTETEPAAEAVEEQEAPVAEEAPAGIIPTR